MARQAFVSSAEGSLAFTNSTVVAIEGMVSSKLAYRHFPFTAYLVDFEQQMRLSLLPVST